MDSNESSKMSSSSTIDIVQSLMQEAFESSYEKMDFLNDQEDSKGANTDNNSSQSEFERLLSEGIETNSESIVDNLSKETTVNLIKNTTVDLDKEGKFESSKNGERMEDVDSLNNSEDFNLTLDDSNTSIEATKEAIKTPVTLDDSNTSSEATKDANKETATEFELEEQSSTKITEEQINNDSQDRSSNKDQSNGMIQITDVVSQTDSNKTLSSETNKNQRNGDIAESERTESLEEMLETLDGPAEPDIIESDVSMNNRRNSSLISSADDNATAAVQAVHQYIADSCQDVEIKVEVESEEEVTYTETFCDEQVEPVNRENDLHYFKMFECKGLTIDLHDIIKTESARDAKAGLYKPDERRCIDIIRKEYKTKAMQDYITRVKRMRLPEENYNKRSSYNNKNNTAQVHTPMVSINLSATKNSYSKNNTPKPKLTSSTPKKSKTRPYTPKKSLTKYWQTNKSTKSKSSPKVPNKIQSKKKAPQKMKVKFSFQKKTQKDYHDESSNYDDDFDDDDDDVDEDYEPSKAATNYKCVECREYFETQAELNIHKRMEHSDSSKYSSWNAASKTVSKNKKSKKQVKQVKNKNAKPVYVKSESKKIIRGILPVYFRSNQCITDGVNGLKKVQSFKPSARTKNLNKQDMIHGAKLVYNRKSYPNYELGKNITDIEMYQHMVKKYTIKAAKLCIGKNNFSTFYQLAKSPSDPLRAKITTVREERGHVLITSPLLHW